MLGMGVPFFSGHATTMQLPSYEHIASVQSSQYYNNFRAFSLLVAMNEDAGETSQKGNTSMARCARNMPSTIDTDGVI